MISYSEKLKIKFIKVILKLQVLLSLLILFLSSTVVKPARGANDPGTGAAGHPNLLVFGDIANWVIAPFRDIGQVITSLLQAAIFVGGLLFFIFFLIGGLQWITSGGDKEAVTAARNKIVNALIGLVILVGAFSVIKIIEVIFGVCIISGCKIPGPTP
jgi:hypothetical protein